MNTYTIKALNTEITFSIENAIMGQRAIVSIRSASDGVICSPCVFINTRTINLRDAVIEALKQTIELEIFLMLDGDLKSAKRYSKNITNLKNMFKSKAFVKIMNTRINTY
jgi:hypothetical protein